MSFVIERTLEIAAPADVVWEVLTDFPHYAEWNPFLLDCKTTLKPGDPIDLRVKLLGPPQRQVEQMLEHVPGRRFAYCMKPFPAGALRSLRSHDVESLGGSRTRYRSYFHLQGWLMPLVRALLGGRLQKGFSGMWEGLQMRSEQVWKQRQAKAA